MVKTITLTEEQVGILNDINGYLTAGDFAQMYDVSEDEGVCLARPWDDLISKVNGA